MCTLSIYREDAEMARRSVSPLRPPKTERWNKPRPNTPMIAPLQPRTPTQSPSPSQPDTQQRLAASYLALQMSIRGG